MNFLHARGYLVFKKARTHRLHCVKVRVDREIDSFLDQCQLAGRFHLAHCVDQRGNVHERLVWHSCANHSCADAEVRVAFFLLRRQKRVDLRIYLGELPEIAREAIDWLNCLESGFCGNPGITGPYLRTFPFFLREIARRKVENFTRGIGRLAIQIVRDEKKSRTRLVVPGEIVEVRLLKEDGDFGSTFMARVPENHDGSLDHRPELRAAVLIFRIGLGKTSLHEGCGKGYG